MTFLCIIMGRIGATEQISGWRLSFITLPDDAAGKDVTIIMETREPDVFTSIDNPTIMSTNDVYRICKTEYDGNIY